MEKRPRTVRPARRYGIATLLQIGAVPVVLVAPRVRVAIALLCGAFFLLPQPKPRYKPGEEPSERKIGGVAPGRAIAIKTALNA